MTTTTTTWTVRYYNDANFTLYIFTYFDVSSFIHINRNAFMHPVLRVLPCNFYFRLTLFRTFQHLYVIDWRRQPATLTDRHPSTNCKQSLPNNGGFLPEESLNIFWYTIRNQYSYPRIINNILVYSNFMTKLNILRYIEKCLGRRLGPYEPLLKTCPAFRYDVFVYHTIRMSADYISCW